VDGHRALIADLLTVVDLRDWPKLGELVAPDVIYNRPGYPPMSGRAELVEFYRTRHIVVNGRHQIDRVVCDDGEGFCWGRFDGMSHSGVPLSETFAEWFAFRGGLVWRRRTFFYRPAI
jgi:ketosteroid isomerase-like protein